MFLTNTQFLRYLSTLGPYEPGFEDPECTEGRAGGGGARLTEGGLDPGGGGGGIKFPIKKGIIPLGLGGMIGAGVFGSLGLCIFWGCDSGGGFSSSSSEREG